MDRTQKKCVVASTGIHLLLAMILVIGPAFGSSRNTKTDDPPLLDFVPVKTVDDLITGGGYRDGHPPTAAPVEQAQPPTQPPPPKVEKQPDPEPPKETKEPAKEPAKPKEEPDSLVPSNQAKRKVEINTTLVTRKRDASDAKAKAEAKAKEEAKAWAEARRQLVQQLGRTADRIGESVAGSTSIKLQGPGGGGVPYANFMAAVQKAYQDAWVVPDGVEDNQAIAVASVTIARDGTVLRHHLISRSGNSIMDHSVQATLDRVTFAAPLPDNAKENERTVNINFNLKARQGLG